MSVNQGVMLTATQKAILAILYNSPSPETAFEAINGSPTLITARNLLERLQLIQVAGNKAVLTDAGRGAVVSNGLVDEQGQLTDLGAGLIEEVNQGTRKVSEGFSLLKSLMGEPGQ